MMRDTDENKLINRYLLGELSEDELAQIEERYFADEDFFARLVDAENSLVDSYVRGSFSAIERGKFERQFLTTPQRRQKVKFARSLRKAVADSQTVAAANVTADEVQHAARNRETSWWQSLAGIFRIQGPALALGMGAVLLMFLGIWQISELRRSNPDIAKQILIENSPQSNIQENVQTENEVASTNASPQKPVNTQTKQQSDGQKPRNEKQTGEAVERPEKRADKEDSRSEKSNPQPPQPTIATIVLMPGLVRGEEGKRTEIIIPPRAKQIRLQLNLEEDLYSRYRAVLQNPDGTEVWEIRLPQMKKKNGKSVTLLVPAKVLSKGDYRLILKGETDEGELETAGEYPFSVVKKLTVAK